MNPKSFVIFSPALTSGVRYGTHCLFEPIMKAVVVARIPQTNMIPNHGMTCTNSTVLKVARLMDLEVKPIHIPNHASAAILARTATPLTVAENAGISHSSPPRPPGVGVQILSERMEPRTPTTTIRTTGAAKVLSKLRHCPWMIRRVVSGPITSNSISPLRRAWIKKRHAWEATHRYNTRMKHPSMNDHRS